jgi:putative tryptophan/tyrosine transport system substrate-binding protein
MNRRKFIGGSASAGLLAGVNAGWLGAARAQQQNLPVIGFLDGVWGHLNAQVGRGFRENGGRGNIEFSRWTGKRSDFQADEMARYAAELVKRQVALILAFSTKAALAAKTVTSTTPIIFLADDPVATGLVDSLDRPGGNLTGAAGPVSGLIAKRIEILRELFPMKNLVVLVTDPTNKPAHDIEIREAQAAAKALGLQLSIIAWTGEHDFEIELVGLPRDRKAALVFGGGLPFFAWRDQLAFPANNQDGTGYQSVESKIARASRSRNTPRQRRRGDRIGAQYRLMATRIDCRIDRVDDLSLGASPLSWSQAGYKIQRRRASRPDHVAIGPDIFPGSHGISKVPPMFPPRRRSCH